MQLSYLEDLCDNGDLIILSHLYDPSWKTKGLKLLELQHAWVKRYSRVLTATYCCITSLEDEITCKLRSNGISKITRFLWHLVPAGASLYKMKKAGREKKSKPGLLRCKHTLDSSHRVTHKVTSLCKTLPDGRSNACCGHRQSRCKLDTNNYQGRFSSIFYWSSQIDVPKLLN